MALPSRTKLWSFSHSELNPHSPRVILLMEIWAISWSQGERRRPGQASAQVQGLWQQEAVTCCPIKDLRSRKCPDWGKRWPYDIAELGGTPALQVLVVGGVSPASLSSSVWLRSGPSAISQTRLMAPGLWATAGWASSFCCSLFLMRNPCLVKPGTDFTQKYWF